MSVIAFEKPVGRWFGKVKFAGDRWHFLELEPHVSIRLKQVFPRISKQAAVPFSISANDATHADLEWFCQRYPLEFSEADRRVLRKGASGYRKRLAHMESILGSGYVLPAYVGLKPGQEIRHYQGQAIELADHSGGLLLGDECGLGKTFTGAGFCLDPKRLPAAVVCQPHIQRQWEDVLTAFTTLRVHRVRKAKAYELPPADVYVFRYSQIAGWPEIFNAAMFKAAIYDEPQELRTGDTTQKGKAAAILTDKAGWTLGLTATPIYGYGSEIFNVMRFINPGVLGDWSDFEREYLDYNGMLQNPQALGTFLREQHAFLRRTKADVGKELPPVNRIVDTVPIDYDALESVEKLARQLAIKATTGSFVERGNAARELDIMVRHATGVAKAPYVADVVRLLVESGESVLLMGWHRDVYDIWNRRLKDLSPAMYTGTESAAQKVKAKNAFLDGETNVLIMSLRSAAGLDGLQKRCSTIVFGELDWSPGIHHQCIERLSREGQDNPVMAMFLVSEEGSDPPMMQVLGIKGSEAHNVVDPELGVQAAHSDEGRLKALIELYLHKRGKK